MEEEKIDIKVPKADTPKVSSARNNKVKPMIEMNQLNLDEVVKTKDGPMRNNFLQIGGGKGRTDQEELQYQRDKESAEAKISSFDFPFRQKDPDKRLRVQAIIEKTVKEAKAKINKKQFAKHLQNSKLQQKDIKDSTRERTANDQKVRDEFYVQRDKLIFEQTQFEIKAEEEYQAKCHHKFESNNAENAQDEFLIIDSLSKSKQNWDLLILILAIFNSFAVPLEYVITDLTLNENYALLDLVINILFIIDIAVGFRTTYFDSLGMEIRDPKQIMNTYLSGMFIVDFLSSIPYRYVKMVFPPISYISFFKILKIARISRFAPFVQKLELTEEDKAMLKIFQLLLILVLILHCLGCVWFVIVSLESTWAPPLDFIYIQRNEYNRFYDLEQVTQTYQFLCVLYLGVLALGGNEMGPRTDTEIASMFMILVGLILVNAYVFGQMSVLVSEASKKSAHLQKQIDVANTSMNNLELKPDTKTDIRMYLISTQGTQYEQDQLQRFFKLLSPTLAEEVSIEIFLEVVQRNLQMRTATMQIAKHFVVANPFPKRTVAEAEVLHILPIVTRMETLFFKPDDPVIGKLEDTKGLFFIAKGECVVDFRHGNLNTQDTSQLLRQARKHCGIEGAGEQSKHKLAKTKVLRQGQLFGEIALIYDCVTTASVIAQKYCTIGKLEPKYWEEVVNEHPSILQHVKAGIFEYQDKDMRFIKMALKQLPFFQHLQDTDTIFYDIIYKLKTEKNNAGTELLGQTPVVDEITKKVRLVTDIIIIESGQVEIFMNVDGKQVVLERLFRGSVINYKSIFLNKELPREIGLRFSCESVIKKLSSDDLKMISKKNQELKRAIDKFTLKVIKLPAAPLDYILMLPKKVFAKMIDRTREKMLFSKQRILMDELELKKKDFKKYQGLNMDDLQIAKTLKELQQEMLTDQEVVHFLTKMNHLELRVKNVATIRLMKQLAVKDRSNMMDVLAQVVKAAAKKKPMPKLSRMSTSVLKEDGLVSRLSEQITVTARKIANQKETLFRIQQNVKTIMPSAIKNQFNTEEDQSQTE